METICILGRQPKLSLAELESRFGTRAIIPIGTQAALIKKVPSIVAEVPLGGTLKVGKVLSHTTAKWQTLLDYCRIELPTHIAHLPEGKLQLGISAYGIRTNAKELQRMGLQLKKILRSTGRSVRVIPNQAATLNTAQVFHNRLTKELGMELLFVSDGRTTYIAQTIAVQDINSYSARDFGRPKRSSFVGMLPPKLAQIMLNLAQVQPDEVVLDPFCGTGVVLQEAALMGCKVYGTDLEQKMIDFTQINLRWLQDTLHLPDIKSRLTQSDAQTASWQSPIDHVVCETYLGQPLSAPPSSQKLTEIMTHCDQLTRRFLQNLHDQLPSQARCLIAVPAWFVQNRFLHLSVIDQLEELGYNRISFRHASNQDMIYHRPDQIVARELLVITRK